MNEDEKMSLLRKSDPEAIWFTRWEAIWSGLNLIWVAVWSPYVRVNRKKGGS